MQSIQEIKNQVFIEVQEVIEQLKKIENIEDFSQKETEIRKLIDLHHFITQINKYTNTHKEIIENQTTEPTKIEENIEETEDQTNAENTTNTQENQTDTERTPKEQEKIEETSSIENTSDSEKENLQETTTQENTIEKEKNTEEDTTDKTNNKKDKKVKLPNIKALAQKLPIFEEGQKPIQGEFFADTHPKTPKPFKLDLNDKLAFTKNLFDGSQHELNETVKILNSFDNIENAKEYLSDMYYEKKWEKVDDYAQRLWSLVENRFL